MLNSLKVGARTFPINFIQGPLAGISCAPFRYLTWKYSQPAFSYSEMISCKALIYQARLTQQRYLVKDPQEGPICYQLVGNNPHDIAEAAKIVTAHGADLIDLNCGCSVKKIRSKGEGSSLLTDATKLFTLLTALKNSTHLPVSAKIRITKNNLTNNLEIIKAIAESGIDMLVVHGRDWNEKYDIPCDYSLIRMYVEALKIPVIGNGDIFDVQSLRKMFATGCAGVMLARAGVGQPWLIKKLIAELNNEVFVIPSICEIGAIFQEHVQRLVEMLQSEKFAVLQARTLAKYYARKLPNKAQFCEAIITCDNMQDFIELINQYYRSE